MKLNEAKNILKLFSSMRLVEEFKHIRTRGIEIFNNLNRIIDEYLKNNDSIHPMFLDMVESECQEAVLAREMTQEQMYQILDRLAVSA